MGGNGSFSSGSTNSEAGRAFKTVAVIGDIHVLQKKNPKDSNKLPEESHTPNRIYAIIRKDGKDVGSIAKYDSNGKKIWEIHTGSHNGISPHYHKWDNGRQEKTAHHLTNTMKEILDKVRNFKDK